MKANGKPDGMEKNGVFGVEETNSNERDRKSRTDKESSECAKDSSCSFSDSECLHHSLVCIFTIELQVIYIWDWAGVRATREVKSIRFLTFFGSISFGGCCSSITSVWRVKKWGDLLRSGWLWRGYFRNVRYFLRRDGLGHDKYIAVFDVAFSCSVFHWDVCVAKPSVAFGDGFFTDGSAEFRSAPGLQLQVLLEDSASLEGQWWLH